MSIKLAEMPTEDKIKRFYYDEALKEMYSEVNDGRRLFYHNIVDYKRNKVCKIEGFH
jgi:hypothetical protein